MSTRQDLHANSPQNLSEVVFTISHELSTQRADDLVLQGICQRLAAALAVEAVAIVRAALNAAESTVIAESAAHLGKHTTIAQAGFAPYQQLKATLQPVSAHTADLDAAHRARLASLQSLLFVPLLVVNDLAGFLLIGSERAERSFTEHEQQALQTVAAPLAISLRNIELFDELQRRANQLDQITAFGRLVTSTLDRRRILQHVIEIVPNLLPADQLSVALLSAGQSRMHVTTLNKGAPLQEHDLAAAGSGVEEVVQTQNPILLADLHSSTYTDHARMREQGLRSLLIAPLTVSGRTFGAVMTGHQRTYQYSPTDLALLQQIGNQIAIALENARQFQTTRQRAQQEEALSEIVSHLQQQADLRVMLQQTMQDLGHLLGARRARVRLQVTPAAKPKE